MNEIIQQDMADFYIKTRMVVMKFKENDFSIKKFICKLFAQFKITCHQRSCLPVNKSNMSDGLARPPSAPVTIPAIVLPNTA